MTKVSTWLVVAALAAWSTQATALDQVRRLTGGSVSGNVTSVTATEVVVEKSGGNETVPVNDIHSIQWDGEPSQIKLIRSAVTSGSWAGALAQIEKLDPSELKRAEVQQDLQFYRAICTAKLALGGAGDVAAAGKLMFDFVSQHPNSYHQLNANEVLGDLLVASGKPEEAFTYYAKLEQSPFAEYQMKAGVAKGRALLKQGKAAEAQAEFDKVIGLAAQASSTAAQSQKFAATLGKANTLAASKQYDEAITLVTEVINSLGPEETALMAQAYVTLGNCYRAKPDSVKPALLAYLHVDVLYPAEPEAHAEALANLAQLWNQVGKNERGTEAAMLLRERYGNSTWAQQQPQQ